MLSAVMKKNARNHLINNIKIKGQTLWVYVGYVVLWEMVLTAMPCRAGLFEEATQDKASQEEKLARPEDHLGLEGFLRADLYVGKVPEADRTEVKNGYAEAAMKLSKRFGSVADMLGEVRLRAGYDGQVNSAAFDLREAFLNLYLGPFDLRLGRQIIAWGRADAFNPTDNLTPRDMRVRSPLEDDRRLGNWAIRAWLNLQPLRWELVWVPFFAPSSFPAFSLPGPVNFAAPAWPDTKLENGTVAARLNFEFAAAEFSLSYLYGTSTFPGIELEQFILGPPPSISLRFRSFRHQVIGADFSTVLGTFGLRGEAALRLPERKPDGEWVPLSDLQAVLGVDREFGDFSVIVQYVGRVVLDFEPLQPTGLLVLAEGGTPTPEQLQRILSDPEGAARTEVKIKTRTVHGQTRQFSHALSLRLGYSLLQETMKMELLGYYNFSTEEALLRPQLIYSLIDGLQLSAGGEIYLGPEDTLFGMIDQLQSAAFFEIKAFF